MSSTTRRNPRPCRRRGAFCNFACATWLFALAGCQTAAPRGPDAPTHADRLMHAYPELRSGRFAVLADFENPSHMELIELVSASPKARTALEPKRGRPETGGAALSFTAGSPEDALLIHNARATNWYLKRDWAAYDLLLLSVEAPRPGLSLELSVAGGPANARMTVSTEQRLERGWNTLRLDLADLAERIPLDDIQEIRLALPGLTAPTELRLDDLILAGSRETLLGDPSAEAALYVQRVGRRWLIGAGGRFELTFANGQIVGWHHVAGDPLRLRNLVQGTALGPTPVRLEVANDQAPDFSAWGDRVIVQARITEMNAVRVVVTADWRFTPDPNAPLDRRPFQRWRYTIYPSGQVFVEVEATREDAAWSAGPLGLAVTLRAEPADRQQTVPASDQSAAAPHAAYAAWRRTKPDAALLFLVRSTAASAGPVRMVQHDEPDFRRMSFIAIAEPAPGTLDRWTAQIVLDSSGNLGAEECLRRAEDAQNPPCPRFELGAPAAPRVGAEGTCGFDHGAGVYVVKPDEGRVRFVLDGARRPFSAPTFQLIDTPTDSCWVYVNHLLHEQVTRDADGRLLFHLPGVIRERVLVEVLFRQGT